MFTNVGVARTVVVWPDNSNKTTMQALKRIRELYKLTITIRTFKFVSSPDPPSFEVQLEKTRLLKSVIASGTLPKSFMTDRVLPAYQALFFT